ncbi:hypothetical protein LTR95_008911 [Oleoguttula sp. CCFEE 5521]
MHSITEMDLEVALSVNLRHSVEAHAHGLRTIDAWFAHEDAEASTAGTLPKEIAKVSASGPDGLVNDEATSKSLGEVAAAARTAALQEPDLNVNALPHAETTTRLYHHNDTHTKKEPAIDAERVSPVAESGGPMSIDMAGGDRPAATQIVLARLSDAEQATISALVTLNTAHLIHTAGDLVMKTDLSEHTPPSTMALGNTAQQAPRTPRAALPYSSGRRTKTTPGAAALRAAMIEEQREGDTPESSPVPFTYARQRGAESVEDDEDLAAEGFEDVKGRLRTTPDDGSNRFLVDDKKNKKRESAAATNHRPKKRSKQADSEESRLTTQLQANDEQCKGDESPLELGDANVTTLPPTRAQKATAPQSRAQSQTSQGPTHRSTMANELRALSGVTAPERQRVPKQSAANNSPNVKTQRRSARFSDAATEEVKGQVKGVGKKDVGLLKPGGAEHGPPTKKRGRQAKTGMGEAKGDAEKVTKRRKVVK